MNRLCTYRLGAERLLGTLDIANPPKYILDKAKTAANYLLDLVLGAEEAMEYQGSTTPANITIIESEPEDIVA